MPIQSVYYRDTGRLNDAGDPIKEPVFLKARHCANKSIFRRPDDENSGLDFRLNAAGDSPENATGYQILMDTMTYLKQEASTQSFYELGITGTTPRSFLPVVVGEGAWANSMLTKRTYQNAGNFESGLVRQGSDNARLASAKASMDSVSYPTFLWADGITYTLMEVEQAIRGANWDWIKEEHDARQKMYQLGIQDITFLGTLSKNMEGLFINTAFPINSSFITAYISSLGSAAFNTFVAGLIAAYWTSTNSTKMPTHFVIPMVDWLGLGTPFPGGTAAYYPEPMIVYLKRAFEAICGPGFKIIPTAYADKTFAVAKRPAYNFNTYALYNYDPKSFRMDIPVDFTTTQPGTYDNFHFQDVGYAQITGMQTFKPLEGLLFQF